MKKLRSLFLICGVLLTNVLTQPLAAQHSVARQWNDVILEAIRNDFARPTVHARNLFHVSLAMYDAWAAYDATAEPYLLGQTIHGFTLPFSGLPAVSNVQAAREEAICYAAYKIISHRFRNSPGSRHIQAICDSLLAEQGYDPFFSDTDYENGSPAALGNYLAEGVLAYGLLDGANEVGNYVNFYYEPQNSPINPTLPGNPFIEDPNRWQPIALRTFIDQSGNPILGGSPPFLSPEWGNVLPFALSRDDLDIFSRDGEVWWVYHDPGPPPLAATPAMIGEMTDYQWGFALVAWWSAHLDPSDSVMWDISPASIGNNPPLPEDYAAMRNFYQPFKGGDQSRGHPINPHTGQPYEPQMVPRGDYTRVLAEFWADGPDSETPPGHWFTILNYVSDHPLLEKRYRGEGAELSDLEWDIKAYFMLGGAMHDAAISAWGIKGYYDYLRPLSALRWMANLGQSSNPQLPNYDPQGLPLVPGWIELVGAGDPLAGTTDQHLGKIKLKAWRGPDYIDSAAVDVAGVGWILAEDWWPYQRPTFVTPPFAGYVSGHSTYSRAAAEVLTLLTGDPFFPGGMGEFVAKKNEFLVFEDGPSVDLVLQWATYRDASDQTSLSRIWGGIHPPADDIPGRKIGILIGEDAFALAETYFRGQVPDAPQTPQTIAYPNPLPQGEKLWIYVPDREADRVQIELLDLAGRQVFFRSQTVGIQGVISQIRPGNLTAGIYLLRVRGEDWVASEKIWIR